MLLKVDPHLLGGQNSVDEQEAVSLSMDGSFVNLLKQMKYENTQAFNSKKGTKIGVVLGKSVVASEDHFSDRPDPDKASLHSSDFLLNLAFEADL
ncbi:hypothetical protein ILUMI_13897 [Ignelater luminosus]|uniref:Uncharacterized protein n=1 Tax=Ignelater luminosus TaxID=2038154 RepID=A0A8K0G5D1_IGNLU|nr:hypothetical protein ILUMI_13897 [Ignelater luminosus]